MIFNTQINILEYGNSYIVWFLSFYFGLKLFFLKPFLLNLNSSSVCVNPSLNERCLKFYSTHKKFTRQQISKKHNAMQVLIRQSMVGTFVGFKKSINLRGVGYKFSSTKNRLYLEVGFNKTKILSQIYHFKLLSSKKGKGMLLKHYSLNDLTSYLAMVKKNRPINLYTRRGIVYRGEKIRFKNRRKKRSF